LQSVTSALLVLIREFLCVEGTKTDPSGTFWQCNDKAIGSGPEAPDSLLQEQYNKVLTVKLITVVKNNIK
jgi:20S proteasome alpha/beta subunit